MTPFSKRTSFRWADLDPNFHVRHSVYYDLGAAQRIEILENAGLTLAFMREHHIGPVLFREECLFRREIRLGDEVIITAKMSRMKADASRWAIQHHLMRDDQKLLAVLTVEGAWIDTNIRKLAASLPPLVQEVFANFPRTEDFELI